MSYFSEEQERVYLHPEEALYLFDACFFEEGDLSFTERTEWTTIGGEVGAISVSIIEWWAYNSHGTPASNPAQMKKLLPSKKLTSWSFPVDGILTAIDMLNDFLSDLVYDAERGRYYGHQLLHDYRKCVAVHLIEVLTWLADGGSWEHSETGWHRVDVPYPELPCDPAYFQKLWTLARDMAASRGEPL